VTRYLLNLLLALDQGVNALAGGDPDETISSRAGKKHPRLAAVIDRLFWFDPRHTQRVIEKDEGSQALAARDRLQVLAALIALIVFGSLLAVLSA
jgi:hypothetical protein